ncbi:hypothetical protein PG993_002327 [Apiospora rasikravindrae]|uniref:Rhodopsin domain-containing protein n=1 Tax=Apiospora rasikravindrae TaxID=990691 RepID=A0ABR1TWG1_9PEZI
MAAPGSPALDVISDEAVRVAQCFYGVTIPLVAVATATCGYRMLKSTRSRSIWSDTCIIVGYALTITDWGLFMPQMFLTPGTKPAAAVLEGAKGSFLAIPVWGMAMAFIKASIGLTLLHIQQSFWFRALVWANIALAGGYGFGNMWFILFSCRPLEAAWGDFADPTEANCLPPSSLKAAALTGAIVSISTDIMLSLAPITFLWSLKRPFRERVVIGILMSLGVLAGVSSLVKILMIGRFGTPGIDMPALNGTISTWTVLEQLLGVIAACTPFCKPIFERCLRAVGVSLTKSGRSGAGGPSGVGGSRANYQRATEHDTFRSQITAERRSKYDSDEDPLNIEMEAGLRSDDGLGKDANGRIFKRTEVSVETEELRADNAADGWKKYTP